MYHIIPGSFLGGFRGSRDGLRKISESFPGALRGFQKVSRVISEVLKEVSEHFKGSLRALGGFGGVSLASPTVSDSFMAS